jgi:ketosteroid isomerase-like protein
VCLRDNFDIDPRDAVYFALSGPANPFQVLFVFMNRRSTLLVLILLISIRAFGQSDLQKLVDTENAFANAAAQNGTRAAFLEFLADDSMVFNPGRSNGKQVWTARKESPSLLSWYPIFADISASGLIGYTTGPWEYRPKGKDDAPTGFGHYMTIWQKQPNGNFRAVLDLGVTHGKPETPETKLTSVNSRTGKEPESKSYAGDTAARFFDTASKKGLEKAYKEFAADDIRVMRQGKEPFVGKKAALKEIAENKNSLSVSKRMSFYGSDDVAYATNTYSFTKEGQTVETGNFVQIWKNRAGRWQIVLDIFITDPK